MKIVDKLFTFKKNMRRSPAQPDQRSHSVDGATGAQPTAPDLDPAPELNRAQQRSLAHLKTQAKALKEAVAKAEETAVSRQMDNVTAAFKEYTRTCEKVAVDDNLSGGCLLYTSPSPRDVEESRMPSSA